LAPGRCIRARSASPRLSSASIPQEVAFAKRIVEAMPDGTGAAMIDGKMQDDATWKQAKVILDLARLVASRDPERKALYGL
jgi:malyl-CoA/(S)-citramalyl-CoA lyase